MSLPKNKLHSNIVRLLSHKDWVSILLIKKIQVPERPYPDLWNILMVNSSFKFTLYIKADFESQRRFSDIMTTKLALSSQLHSTSTLSQNISMPNLISTPILQITYCYPKSQDALLSSNPAPHSNIHNQPLPTALRTLPRSSKRLQNRTQSPTIYDR